MNNHIIVVDVETGGKNARPHFTTKEHNGITQIAVRIIEPAKFKLVHAWDTFIKPYDGTTINPDALKYTRVSMKQINTGVDVNVALKGFVDCIKIANKSGKQASAPIICGHNIEFDIDFLEYLFERKNKNLYDYVQRNMLDTLWLCKLAEAGVLKSDDVGRYTLTACCERFGIKHTNAHGATGDTQVTEQLLKKLLLRMREGRQTTLEQETKPSKQRENFQFDFFEM